MFLLKLFFTFILVIALFRTGISQTTWKDMTPPGYEPSGKVFSVDDKVIVVPFSGNKYFIFDGNEWMIHSMSPFPEFEICDDLRIEAFINSDVSVWSCFNQPYTGMNYSSYFGFSRMVFYDARSGEYSFETVCGSHNYNFERQTEYRYGCNMIGSVQVDDQNTVWMTGVFTTYPISGEKDVGVLGPFIAYRKASDLNFTVIPTSLTFYSFMVDETKIWAVRHHLYSAFKLNPVFIESWSLPELPQFSHVLLDSEGQPYVINRDHIMHFNNSKVWEVTKLPETVTSRKQVLENDRYFWLIPMPKTNGLYYFDLFTEALVHLTTANSNLSSDQVYDLAIDNHGNKWIVTENSVMVYNVLGAVFEPREMQVHQSPNPARHSFDLQFAIPEDAFVEINLYDLTGRLVKVLHSKNLNQGNHSLHFSVADLQRGFYLLNIKSHQSQKTIRLVIN